VNIYDVLYWLVTLIGIAAAGAVVYLIHLLWTVHLSMGALHAWLDKASDEYADYMDDERDRRTAKHHGDPDASSLRRYYGLSYLLERALFRIQYDLACWLFLVREQGSLRAARKRMKGQEDAGFQEV
jgi:hypothetical protein